MKTGPLYPRRRRSAAQWNTLLATAEASNMSFSDFSRQKGISRSRLYYWQARLRRSSQKDTSSPAFLPVKVQQSTKNEAVVKPALSVIEIVAPNGRIARVVGEVHPDQVRQILAIIEQGTPAC